MKSPQMHRLAVQALDRSRDIRWCTGLPLNRKHTIAMYRLRALRRMDLEYKTDGWCQAAAGLNHERSDFRPSEFPHSVPLLEPFLWEQLSSFYRCEELRADSSHSDRAAVAAARKTRRAVAQWRSARQFIVMHCLQVELKQLEVTIALRNSLSPLCPLTDGKLSVTLIHHDVRDSEHNTHPPAKHWVQFEDGLISFSLPLYCSFLIHALAPKSHYHALQPLHFTRYLAQHCWEKTRILESMSASRKSSSRLYSALLFLTTVGKPIMPVISVFVNNDVFDHMHIRYVWTWDLVLQWPHYLQLYWLLTSAQLRWTQNESRKSDRFPSWPRTHCLRSGWDLIATHICSEDPKRFSSEN